MKKITPDFQQTVPLFVTIPHSGEEIPREAPWLRGLDPEVLLLDVDRFVGQLYEPALIELQVPSVVAKVHRYAVDLNRFPDDVDQDAVFGAAAASGKFPNGFHWVRSTRGHRLMTTPIPAEAHQLLVEKFHDPFHQEAEEVITELKKNFPKQPVFHLDCHSMPSQGTDSHQDVGRARAEVVVSDFHGRSSAPEFKDCVIDAFRAEGFEVAYNWPYYGGRITQRYGKPDKNHHTIQIELNRKLYLDEKTRQKLPEFPILQMRLKAVMARIVGFLDTHPTLSAACGPGEA